MRLSPLLALALLGCQQPSEPAPAEQEAPSPNVAASTAPEARSAASLTTSIAITDTAELIGEYRIAGVGGAEIDLPHGVTARITADAIHVVSDCVNLSWNYAFEETGLVTERLPDEGCGRALLSEEEAILAAFDSAKDVARTPANGVEFSGGGHSVLLFSQ